MKIADIVLDILENPPAASPQQHRRFASTGRTWTLITRILAEDGTEGLRIDSSWGRCDEKVKYHRTYMRAHEILTRIKPELVGRDVADREWLWSQRYIYQWWGQISDTSISAVDEALWDLAAKLRGQPVYKLLGAARDKVPAYASMGYVEDPEDYARLARSARDAGYRAFKIRPDGGGVDRVKTIARLCREAVGDMAFMVDGQMQFSVEEALEIGYHLQDLDFEWWEDAIPHDQLANYDLLAERLRIPLAYTDHAAVRYPEIAELLRSHPGIRIVRSDAMRDGITGLKKVCDLAGRYGKNCEIHAYSPGNLHVTFAVENCKYYEDNVGPAIDWENMRWRARADDDPLRIDEDGCISAPTEPGVGYHLPDDLEERRIERLS